MPHVCTGRRPKHYRMFGSKPRKEVTMTKARLIFLAVSLCMLAAMYAGAYAKVRHGFGPVTWSDGH